MAVVMGTSVTSYWNRTTLTLELKGVDTLDAYMGVLATTRYTHSGLVVDVPNRTRATAFLEFTAGQRNFVITVEDTDGATANASVSVDVQDVIRAGRPSRDENQANPEECSGYGSTKLTIVRILFPKSRLHVCPRNTDNTDNLFYLSEGARPKPRTRFESANPVVRPRGVRVRPRTRGRLLRDPPLRGGTPRRLGQFRRGERLGNLHMR